MTRTQLFWSATLLFAAIGLQSCTKDVTSESFSEGPAAQVAAKLIHTSENAEAGTLSVCFSDEALEIIEAAATRSEGTATRAGIADVDEALELIGTHSLRPLFHRDPRHEAREREFGLHRWYIVDFDEEQDLDAAAIALAQSPAVSYVEFNQKLVPIAPKAIFPASESGLLTRAASVNYPDFNDPQLDLQWHYINTGDTRIYKDAKAGADVNCAAAWKVCTGDPRVVVAVVDQAVDWEHPDLAANMWVNPEKNDSDNGYTGDVHGYNFVDNGPLRVSTKGDAPEHGTHIAGTIAAVNNNGIGVSGIAGGSGNGDGVRIMSCQVFRDNKGGSTQASANAMKYAADNGAAILQCSYGYATAAGPKSDSDYATQYGVELTAISYFIKQQNCAAVDGGIVVFAAGNDGFSHSCYPGAYRDNLSVTAMSCDYTPAYYTCYGPGCNISAPGGDYYQSAYDYDAINSEASMVLSTINGNGYGYSQGTSMACPHVSGVVALGLSYALQQGKKYTRDEFLGLITTSVNNINPYCVGQKRSDGGAQINLSSYAGKMGTGFIDAFQLLMNIDGTTCIPVAVGSQTTIDLRNYFGNGDLSFAVSKAEIADSDMARLGIKAQPTVFNGNILLTCEKVGSCVMTVTLQAGTSNGNGINGMNVTKKVAILARDAQAVNGGWL